MKVRLFTVFILVESMVALALVQGGARPLAAQSRPAAPAPTGLLATGRGVVERVVIVTV